MTHISIQVTMVKAFEASELIGETTTDELEDDEDKEIMMRIVENEYLEADYV